MENHTLNNRLIEFYEPEGQWGFLANYFPFTFENEGKFWPSLEHCYQALKFQDNSIRERIRKCKKPNDAKAIARENRERWRSDFAEVKAQIMLELLRAKFSQSLSLKEKLLNTGERFIVERGPHPFWCLDENDKGTNTSGQLLMKVRNELKAEKI